MLKTANPQQYAPANGAEYPRSAFGEALRQIAQLVKADVGLEVAFAESGNWDHHANEGAATGQLANRLDDLARGIAALVRDLGDRMQDVVDPDDVGVRPRGRRERQPRNRSRPRQRDDGHRRRVRGGKVYGRWPGLAPEQRYDGRDLAVTTDFRGVFAEVVRGHLGLTDTRTVFPGFPQSDAGVRVRMHQRHRDRSISNRRSAISNCVVDLRLPWQKIFPAKRSVSWKRGASSAWWKRPTRW